MMMTLTSQGVFVDGFKNDRTLDDFTICCSNVMGNNYITIGNDIIFSKGGIENEKMD